MLSINQERELEDRRRSDTARSSNLKQCRPGIGGYDHTLSYLPLSVFSVLQRDNGKGTFEIVWSIYPLNMLPLTKETGTPRD